MATEDTKKPSEDTPKLNRDWLSADKKVESIEAQLLAAKGKNGMNPFMWRKKNNWDSLVAGIKSRQESAATELGKIPATIDCSVPKELKGPIIV